MHKIFSIGIFTLVKIAKNLKIKQKFTDKLSVIVHKINNQGVIKLIIWNYPAQYGRICIRY